MLNHQSVTVQEFIELAPAVIKVGHVPIGVGQAGAGKTESGYQIYENMGYDYILKINPNTMEITDLHGTPAHGKCEVTQTNVTDWYAPKHWVNLIRAHAEGKKCGVIIDELFQADDVQAKFIAKFILERMAGDLQIPKETAIIAFGNRPEDNSLSATELGAMTWDRFKAFEFKVDAGSWLEWAIPAGVVAEIIAGVRTHPRWINEGFDADQYKSCTPRSLTHLSDLIKSGGVPSGKLELPIIQAYVGNTVGLEFIAFRRVMNDLPNRTEIYKNPLSAPLPADDRTDVFYALVSALGSFATKENLSATVQYCERLPLDWAIIALGDVWKKDNKLAWSNKDYQRFALANKNVKIFTDILSNSNK
jgi:hypothetical protein